MGNDAIELLAKITGLLLALGGVAAGFARVMRWMGTDKRVAVRYEILAFQANIKALQEENARCWADNARIREEHAVECEERDEEEQRLRKRIDDCEDRLNARRDQVHKLGNQLQEVQTLLHIYIMRFGNIEVGDDEAKQRRDPEDRSHFDENGEPK